MKVYNTIIDFLGSYKKSSLISNITITPDGFKLSGDSSLNPFLTKTELIVSVANDQITLTKNTRDRNFESTQVQTIIDYSMADIKIITNKSNTQRTGLYQSFIRKFSSSMEQYDRFGFCNSKERYEYPALTTKEEVLDPFLNPSNAYLASDNYSFHESIHRYGPDMGRYTIEDLENQMQYSAVLPLDNIISLGISSNNIMNHRFNSVDSISIPPLNENSARELIDRVDDKYKDELEKILKASSWRFREGYESELDDFYVNTAMQNGRGY